MIGLSSLFLLMTATAVCSQSVADLPSCSLSCFATAVGETSCSATDYTCQCTAANAAAIKESVTNCLAKSTCSLSDDEKVQSFGNTFCPSVLASASAASTQAPSTASTKSTFPSSSLSITTPASIATISPSTPSSTRATLVSSAAGALSTDYGAGTAGTTWGDLNLTPSNVNRGPAFAAVSVILVAIAALVLAFRFFARLYTKSIRQVVKGLGADEWFALASLLITAGVTADIIVGNEYGMGKHFSSDTTASQLIVILKLVYVFVLLITASFGVLKISILCLYLRMTPERSHHITLYVLMGIVVAHETASFTGGVFQCTPISSYWSLGNPLQSPHCLNILAFDTFNSAWSLLEDFVIWFLPIPVVWNLKVPLARKTGLYSLIAISFIAVICSTVRMVALVVWMRSADISWNYPLLPFFANMEACVAIMTSSVPAIWPLFRRTPPDRQMTEPPPLRKEPEKEWDSVDSQDGTAVPSTVHTDTSSKRWSFLSRNGSIRSKFRGEKDPEDGKHMTTIQSESGPRTELKSVFEESEGADDFIPGLAR